MCVKEAVWVAAGCLSAGLFCPIPGKKNISGLMVCWVLIPLQPVPMASKAIAIRANDLLNHPKFTKSEYRLRPKDGNTLMS